jgi:hypothetical protein
MAVVSPWIDLAESSAPGSTNPAACCAWALHGCADRDPAQVGTRGPGGQKLVSGGSNEAMAGPDFRVLVA